MDRYSRVMDKPMLSLVLATVGRTTDLDRCLDSLAAQSSRDFEVLVVDQNPDDRLVPHVQRARVLGLAVRHVRLDRPSLSGARNLGIREAAGQVVGFPDDDCWYEPDVVEKVLGAFLASETLGGVCVNWAEQSAVHGVPVTGEVLSLVAWRAYRGGDASSITLFLRTALLRELGGFDERLGVGQRFGAAEEIDLVLRFLGTGARIERFSEARVHHFYGAPPPQPLSRLWSSTRSRARGTGAIYAKHSLSLWVVSRGLAAPLLRFCMAPSLSTGVAAVATTFGRLEGLLTWNRDRPVPPQEDAK